MVYIGCIDGVKNLTDPQEIANKFNDFFTSIVLKYIPVHQNEQISNNDHLLLSNFIQTKIAPSMTFSIPPIQEERVHELLTDLYEHKMTGLDGVSAKRLRLASPVITRLITKLINTSINTGHFPTKLKMGRVTPIHKAGNKSECNNFRNHHNTLYTTQTFGKTCSQLLAQSGFHALHSCETALIKIIDKWTSNMEKGHLNEVVLLDLRKAFDLVDTVIVLV